MENFPMISTIVNGKEVMVSATTSAYNRFGIIPICEEITPKVAQEVEALIYQAERDITLVINSPGGEVSSAQKIVDAIENCGFSVTTVCSGIAASAASLILASGTKGKRYAIPNSFIMIHQVSGGANGQMRDVLIAADYMKKVSQKVNEMLSAYTGRTIDEIQKDVDRDNYMTSEQAKKYGIVDHVGRPDSFYK